MVEGIGWIQCDKCDTYFRRASTATTTKDGKTVQNYICPHCGYHGTDVIYDEGSNKEEKDMMNYYTVANAASRLNCSPASIMRAIHDGTFSDVTRDSTFPGTPAYMIPSNQVEWWVERGGILKRRRRKKQETTVEPVVYPQLQKMQDELNKKLNEQSHVTVQQTYEALGLPAAETDLNHGWSKKEEEPKMELSMNFNPKPVDPRKITIEIDASMIEKTISNKFRSQIENLRSAIDTLIDELDRLEAMCN